MRRFSGYRLLVATGVCGVACAALHSRAKAAPQVPQAPQAPCKQAKPTQPLKAPVVQDIASVRRQGAAWMVTGQNYTLRLSAQNGSILALTQKGKPAPLYQSNADGLWRGRFEDNTALEASAFGKTSDQTFVAVSPAPGTLALTYKSPLMDVRIDVKGRSSSLDFTAHVTPHTKTLLDFYLPARLRFAPDRVERFISPMPASQSVGAAFNRAFFQAQAPEDQRTYTRVQGGPTGYISLYGNPLQQRPDGDTPTPLRVTSTGKEWLNGATLPLLDGKEALVNRPPAGGQSDLVLVDSPNGPYYSASHLGGTGLLWRVSSLRIREVRDGVREMVAATIEHLAPMAPPGRTKIGIVSIPGDAYTTIPVSEWRSRLQESPVLRGAHLSIVELPSPAAMLAAANTNDYLAILNPYGEAIPVARAGNLNATVATVGQYVKSGGNWFETGGYPFYYALQPQPYLTWSEDYPTAFADFSHLDSRDGSASIYRVQPRNWAPWAGASNPSDIFLPGKLAFGGDETGGYCERAYTAFTPGSQAMNFPAVRFVVGQSGPQNLRAYSAANGITRRLSDKMSPQVLAKFKGALLLKYDGSATEKIENLGLVPPATLLHFSDYLMGGFDKQYPDHLPPNAKFGTLEQLQAFVSQSHALGHLIMPYSNPTWWPDHPRSPTFMRAGEAPLLRRSDGSLLHESYGTADGWTITFWHPDVQAANRRTVEQFSTEVPVDVLFQDQVGARGTLTDLNPASPTPYAYSEGLLSMADEDSRKKPLSTENGWDRVVNAESELSGLTWSIVPTEYKPDWARSLRDIYPANTWQIYPVAQYIAHDKLAFVHHDLGQFVTNPEVLSWTLGLGYSLSYRTRASDLSKPATREWVRWLDRLQKSLVARYVGEPVVAFNHNRSGLSNNPDPHDDGSIVATYGPVEITSNLGPGPRTINGHPLPGYGFYATAPGVVAATLPQAGQSNDISFVMQGTRLKTDVWLYAPPHSLVTIPLPAGMVGKITLSSAGKPQEALPKGRELQFTTSPTPETATPGNTKYLWHYTVNAR